MIRFLKNLVHLVVAVFASFFYGFPGRKMTIIGVTGTDGKTTTTHLIYHILRQSGKKVSMISSVYAQIAGKQYDTGFHVTTPDPRDVFRYLKKAERAGDQYFVLETTSHALDQNRVYGVNFMLGVLTNVTCEHLDYHKNYLDYLKTKEKLLKKAKIAVVNADDESFKHFSKWNNTVITYAVKSQADFTPRNYPLSANLPGLYNVYNCLAAAAVCHALEIPDELIRKNIKSFTGVKGRFEKVAEGYEYDVIIDFAHTPNALEKVLTAARKMTRNRIIVVFGSAGLRDKSKRPLMGRIAAKLADCIVLTAEDPRTEDVREIIDQIARGCRKEGAIELNKKGKDKVFSTAKSFFFRIPDRQEAINFAIRFLAKKGDLVLLCGKGHEKSMAWGKIEYPWDEYRAVQKAIYGKV